MASAPLSSNKPSFLSLPTEIRLEIVSYVLNQDVNAGFTFCDSSLYPFSPSGLYIDALYFASTHLSLLRTCRQFCSDFTQLAFRRTEFLIRDTFAPVREQLAVLSPLQVSALRKISFVVAEGGLRDMCSWKQYPWDMKELGLECLCVVFHRSGHVLYMQDFTDTLVGLLRRLEGVGKLKIVRNGANVKGFFKTWFNRLVGLMLKEDHHQRYNAPGAPHLPANWWEWRFDEEEQSFELVATKPRDVMDESEYLEMVKPQLEKLTTEMLVEEMDPDPRARVGW